MTMSSQTSALQGSASAPPKLTDQTNYLPRRKIITVFLACASVGTTGLLDETMISVALPTIGSDLGAGSQISWVAAAFFVTSTACQVLYGRLSDIWSRKIVLFALMFIFFIGNIAAGFSQTFVQLLIFRAISGIGGGGLSTVAQIIVSDVVSLRERGKYQGILGASVAFSYGVGPVIGGLFVEHSTWRWIFWLTLPLTVASAAAVYFFMPLKTVEGDWRQKLARIDFVGSLLILLASTLLVLSLTWASGSYRWQNPHVFATLVVGALMSAGFVLWEWKVPTFPVIPMYIFKKRIVIGAGITQTINGFLTVVQVFYLPTFYQLAYGYSPVKSGLLVLPLTLVQTFASTGSGLIVTATGRYRELILAGWAIWAVGLGLLATLNEHSTLGQQGALERKDMAVVTAMRSFARNIGGTIGLAITGTIVNGILASYVDKLDISVELRRSIIDNPVSARSELSPEVLSRVIAGYHEGFRTTFIILASLAAFAFVVALALMSHRDLHRDDDAKLKAEGEAFAMGTHNLHEFTSANEYDLNSFLPVPKGPLETALVTVEPFVPLLHADALSRAFCAPPSGDPDIWFYPYPKGKPFESKEETLIYVEKQRLRANLLTFAVTDRKSGALAGIMSLGCDPAQATLDVKLMGLKIFPNFRGTHVFIHGCYLLLSYALDPVGKNALKDFYDPSKCPPLPLVELPSHPFEDDGVEIFAKMLTLLPAGNVKSLPALNMLLRAVESGEINEDTKRIIEWSSGNTAISLAIISRIYGLGDVSAYISNKNSPAKMQLLRFFGLELSLFGGPAQVNPDDMDGGIRAAIVDGAKEGCYNPSQYTSGRNPEAHIRWTGPQLHMQLPDMSIFAAGLGTAGPRPIDLAPPPADMDLPWKDVIDEAEFATSSDSYQASLELCRQGLLVGPSSGLALIGLYHYLERAKANSELDKFRGPNGKVKCAFICCDQPFQYIGEYFDKLPPSLFPKIINDELLGVDQYPYGTSWTISPDEAYIRIKAPASDRAIVLDLRDSTDFHIVRIIGSIHLDLHCRGDPNPFTSPSVLRRQWLELDSRLHVDDPEFGPKLLGRVIVINSYNGHTGVVASSVLRKKGIEAYAP
ncbi:Efflux pump FUS6 [Mycena venus]|uniref:Efflux pump FUS6 n=1 Tax=Mycena venus TaxID=2733690 RepID=A0A8H6X7A4_9AGAR|nr:Efflux pump FUS6 [Mycena venus]